MGYDLSYDIKCKKCNHTINVSNVRENHPINYNEVTEFLGNLFYYDYSLQEEEDTMKMRRIK